MENRFKAGDLVYYRGSDRPPPRNTIGKMLQDIGVYVRDGIVYFPFEKEKYQNIFVDYLDHYDIWMEVEWEDKKGSC